MLYFCRHQPLGTATKEGHRLCILCQCCPKYPTATVISFTHEMELRLLAFPLQGHCQTTQPPYPFSSMPSSLTGSASGT